MGSVSFKGVIANGLCNPNSSLSQFTSVANMFVATLEQAGPVHGPEQVQGKFVLVWTGWLRMEEGDLVAFWGSREDSLGQIMPGSVVVPAWST